MNFATIFTRWNWKNKPLHLRHGLIGERAAKKHLKKNGLKFLTANFATDRGEIDLVFREQDCLVFVEVKTRSSEDWSRPARAVDAGKQRRLSLTALEYLRLLKNPEVKVRFDIVEVLLETSIVREIRHLPNSFSLAKPYRFG
jgi:putative endonuclease